MATVTLDQHLPAILCCPSPMQNFGAACPVLKSAPLFAHPHAAPFGRVRLADVHDAPHQQDDMQLEYWNFWSCWATSPSHPRLQSPLILAIPANLVFQ